MRFLAFASLAFALALTACTGQIDIAKSSPENDGGEKADGGDQKTNPAVTLDDGGGDHETNPAITPDDGGDKDDGAVALDDGGEWDGWSDAYASKATGPAPSCNSAPLACGTAFPGQPAFASSQEAANALVGQWSFCGDSQSGFYASNQIGEEYTSDGTYYELIMGSDGQPARNMNPSAIGTWQIDLTPNKGVEIHTFSGATQRSGGLSACPPSLVLLGVEARL